MDSITHIVIGTAIAQAVAVPKLGKKALVFAILASSLPDFDVFTTPFLGEFADWKYHRALTHSLWFGPVIGSLMGWVLWKIYGAQKGHLHTWVISMVVSMMAHVGLDTCTIYGTQLMAPFSNHRFEVAAVSIVDPFYTLVILLTVLLPFSKRLRPYAAKLAAGGLLFGVIYLVYGWQQNNKAIELARKQLLNQHISITQITSYTTIFQPYLRRVVVRESPDVLRVGFVSTFAPSSIIWSCQKQAPDDVKSAILATEAGQVFNWFAAEELNITTNQDGTIAEVMDARYGTPGPSVFGWWGTRFSLAHDDSGTVTATYIGKARMDRDASWHAVVGLFRAAYGMENDFLPKEQSGCVEGEESR